MERAYAAIGRAVFAAQLFETVLAPIFQFLKMKTVSGYLEKTGGLVNAGAYKMPVKNIVRELALTGSLASDLEARLTAYVEDRHTLVHRWVMDNGWLEENDREGLDAVVLLANRVEREAESLAKHFVGYMVKYANPTWAAEHSAEYEQRMTQLFHRAHIDA